MEKKYLLKAIKALSEGKIVVYPTDTLYGLGADIYNEEAIKKIFKIKKRPYSIPIPIAVSSLKELQKIAYIDDKTKIVAKKFLPGKLTLILKKRDNISDILTANSDKIAVRIPNNEVALYLISNFGPITATSANIHNLKTPSDIKDIVMQFKESDITVYLDDGKLKGKSSTIIDMAEKKIKIIREGSIEKKVILDVILNE